MPQTVRPNDWTRSERRRTADSNQRVRPCGKRLREAVDERGEPLYTTRDWAAWVLTGEPR